jgi:cell wall-associated NlpC family hydrolase
MAGSHAGRHAAPRRGRRWVILLAVLAVLALLAAAFLIAAPSAPAQPAVQDHAVLASSTETLGQRVLDKAETKVNHWYLYGAAGPVYFDCSGLVHWAAGQLGVYVPHSTYSMLAGTAHLYYIPLSQARRGDLLFFGSGHVEFATIWYHTSFGAHHSGTTVGWRGWSSYYHPTAAMRFR